MKGKRQKTFGCAWPSKKLPRGDHAEVTPIPPPPPWLYIRANIQIWFERFEMSWHPFPMLHIPALTLLVMIGFGLAPVYTDTMSIV